MCVCRALGCSVVAASAADQEDHCAVGTVCGSLITFISSISRCVVTGILSILWFVFINVKRFSRPVPVVIGEEKMKCTWLFFYELVFTK